MLFISKPVAGLAYFLTLSLTLAILLVTPRAAAYSRGLAAEGCSGCHHDGAEPRITVSVNPSNPELGATVTVDVTIEAVNGPVGGFYLNTDGGGRLEAVDGQGTTLLDQNQLIHNTPRRASNGAVRFQARWIARNTPGGAVISVWGISANGNGNPRGDGASSGRVSFAVGCAGTTYYSDFDEDGYGFTESTKVDCTQPQFYAIRGGDCDNNNPNIYPDRDEECNGRDDNCDGQIDENLMVVAQHIDTDGDGHGTPRGETVMAKCPPPGYAPNQDDCDDSNPAVYGGATEVCNFLDDDCDGRVDEHVREVCGVGLCAREAYACAPESCTPGEPSPEACNYLDDDCDGLIDEGDLCEPGTICRDGECIPGNASAGTGGGAAEETGAHSGCAFDPEGASPWGALVLASMAALRRGRRSHRVARHKEARR